MGNIVVLAHPRHKEMLQFNLGIRQRKVIRVDGVPVRKQLLTEVLKEKQRG